MRILHLLNHSLPVQDGYAFRTAAILREQAARGWTTIQVTSDRHPAGEPEEQIADLHFFRTPPRRSWLARQPVAEQLATIATLTTRVEQVARDFRPDILHAHSPCLTGLAALRVGRRLGIPVVYEMRSSWEDAAVTEGATKAGSLRFRLSRALETFVLRRADAVTTICAGLQTEICARGVPADRVTIVPNAVDMTQFGRPHPRSAAIRRQHAPGDERLIGFIGSFYNWEGLDLLVSAAALLRQQRDDFRILLVGGGAEDQRLRAQVAALGLEGVVAFTGRVPHGDVGAYYGAMDLLVYPRPATPLTDMVTPLKPLEAMAAGKPVLASDVAGHRELIRHDFNGLLFSAGKPAALASSIDDALRNADLNALSARAKQWVRDERTWSAAVARYQPVYASIQGRRP
ncbi:MAG: glycosyltransferase, exosortase A system-associated [Gammaproteobacteria bacterium]|nr:glycosyltransferase, exosortase A system-associated [Gammaproteobacteria bacterium]